MKSLFSYISIIVLNFYIRYIFLLNSEERIVKTGKLIVFYFNYHIFYNLSLIFNRNENQKFNKMKKMIE